MEASLRRPAVLARGAAAPPAPVEAEAEDREPDELDALLEGKVADVVAALEAHLEENPDDRDVLHDREAAGKNRSGVLKALAPASE